MHLKFSASGIQIFIAVLYVLVFAIGYVRIRCLVSKRNPTFDALAPIAYVLEYKRHFGRDRLYRFVRYGPFVYMVVAVIAGLSLEICSTPKPHRNAGQTAETPSGKR